MSRAQLRLWGLLCPHSLRTPTFSGFATLPLALLSDVVKASILGAGLIPWSYFFSPSPPTETAHGLGGAAPPSPAFWALLSELKNAIPPRKKVEAGRPVPGAGWPTARLDFRAPSPLVSQVPLVQAVCCMILTVA